MNKEYKIKLDLNKKLYNKKMAFNQFDENVNDFYIEVTKNNEVVKDLDKSIITLVAIKPNSEVDAQFIEVKEGQIYADLKPSMCDLVGNYQAKAMIVLEGEIVTTDTINYSVNEDKIISRLNEDVVSDERFTLFTDALARLSTIETSEEQRMINEAERILSEENRKIEEAKRVEAELVRQHEEADRTKYDAIRESNENIRKQNESIRLANETNRIDEEAKRVEEENKRKLAEEERNANYNFMTEDEERRRSEANAHKEAEVLRVQAETNRVNEEAKRRTTEQARVSAENTRVSNENTREANEITRKSNETKRVEAETQRQNRYNSFITEAEANANNFENYTNTAKVKEEERKANELDRKSQEDRRVSNEVERISNENTRKANEVIREENETSRQNVFENKVSEVDEKIVELNTTKDNFISSINTKVDNKISEIDKSKTDMSNTVSNKIDEVESRFNALTSSQQQDAEVIDARDGETSLKARLDRDIEKAKQVYVNVEGSNISTDSSVGYAKDVEILGNTIQDASNLADIRSVGDKVEGQELYEIPVLSVGKNLLGRLESGRYDVNTGQVSNEKNNYARSVGYIKVPPSVSLFGHYKYKGTVRKSLHIAEYDNKFNFIRDTYNTSGTFTLGSNTSYVRVSLYCGGVGSVINVADITEAQLEEGTVATPYEPYQEDKLTILSPVQLERVGDVADRIIEKDGVWGVEKNIGEQLFDSNSTWTQNSITENYIEFICQNIIPTNIVYGAVSSNFIAGTNQHNIRTSGSTGKVIIQYKISEAPTLDATEFTSYVANNPFIIKYVLAQPQFIPLPHSQQIKLRTFASKTNISFLTEIEGTIKAQVPKSLGATVNTHTEQISNLNKELDRVKKLEESTVSTVTTESDFTTVEATSNGYFEDVKLEGKTLVNICPKPKASVGDGNHLNNVIISDNVVEITAEEGRYTGVNFTQNSPHMKPNTTYTIVANILENTMTKGSIAIIEANPDTSFTGTSIPLGYKGLFVQKTTTRSVYTLPRIQSMTTTTCKTGEKIKFSLMVLEGDHTQNPPSYFEGLKSVGDGVDEIVVSSVNENLFDGKFTDGINTYGTLNIDKRVWFVLNSSVGDFSFKANAICSGTSYSKLELYASNSPNATSINGMRVVGVFNIINGVVEFTQNKISEKYIYICVPGTTSNVFTLNNIMINKGTTPKPYTPHKLDKKRLLYYNNETQTWEKPILRQWDSIEKHADGKYYYHQRSGEVVLNGSESWTNSSVTTTNTIRFLFDLVDNKYNTAPLSDKFKGMVYVRDDIEGAMIGESTNLTISILKSKLPTQDAQGFKQWLQANNVTVVYQLAQEKVYECTNIDLITYANETNYIVESGAIVPRSILKVHNNISNVVSLLQKKVSLLESNVKASQEVQDMMILETDMRMLDIELALMEFIPMTLNLGGSDMLRSATYFNFLKNHIINETYEKEYLENVMNKYLATGRINQDEYNELYKILYPPVYDIELPIEY